MLTITEFGIYLSDWSSRNTKPVVDDSFLPDMAQVVDRKFSYSIDIIGQTFAPKVLSMLRYS